MDKIIVAVDLSDLASVAIDYAASLAKAFKSHVRILHVVAPIPSYLGNEIITPVMPIDNEEERLRMNKELEAMADYLQKQGVEVDYELTSGPVIETIIEKAGIFDADLVVLGAHNHGFLYRAFIGSVCIGVVKHSQCPVLVIPGK